MEMKNDRKRHLFYKKSEVSKVPEKEGSYELIKNKYWYVTKEDELFSFNGCSLQLTRNADKINLIGYSDFHHKVEFIESVWIPIDPYKYW